MCDVKANYNHAAFFLLFELDVPPVSDMTLRKKSCIRIIFKTECYRVIIAEIIKWLQLFTKELYLHFLWFAPL